MFYLSIELMPEEDVRYRYINFEYDKHVINNPSSNSVFVFHINESELFSSNRFKIRTFGNYGVATLR